jgi:tetratricopeptide (TPR) repeat protein/RsiW-degrading membrane proteinase PrsW (M82 family)
MGAAHTFSPSQATALLYAILGSFFIALLIIRLGRGEFSLRLYGAALVTGISAAIAATQAEGLFIKFLQALRSNPILFAFVTAGLVEEVSKFAVAYTLIRPHYMRRSRRDLVLGFAGVALGFGLAENVLYILVAPDEWHSIATIRSIASVPMHGFIGLILGRGLAGYDEEIETKGLRPRMLSVLVVPILLHGFYDLPIFIDSGEPVPLPIQRAIEATLSVDTPTFLACVSLSTVLLICVLSLRVMFTLDRLTVSRAAPGFIERPIHPRWLNRLIFASWTGYVLGGLLSVAAAIFVSLGAILLMASVTPSAIPAGFALGLFPLTIGCGLFIAGGHLATDDKRHGSIADQRGLPRRASHRWKPAAAFLALTGIATGSFYMSGDTLVVPLLLGAAAGLDGAGNADAAATCYDVALRYRPDFAIYVLRAEAYRDARRYAEALIDLDKAVDLQPEDPGILWYRARLQISLHDYRAAAADLDRALALAGEDPHLLTDRAEAAFYLGDRKLADADFARAIELDPTLPEIHEKLASILMSSDTVRAAQELDAALSDDPDFARARFTRGRLYYSSGNFKEAVDEIYAANLKLPDVYTSLWLYLARARIGQDARSELATNTRSLSPKMWPAALTQLYLGKIPIDQAHLSTTNADQACEADFYTAELLILKTSYDDASAALKRAADRCPADLLERAAAILELRRLEGDSVEAPPAPTAPVTPSGSAASRPDVSPASGDAAGDKIAH